MWLNGKDDVVQYTEVNTRGAEYGLVLLASPGSKTMACVTQRRHGNPGGPTSASRYGEGLPTTLTREEGAFGSGKSDHLIVPMKAGNAAGGKEVT